MVATRSKAKKPRKPRKKSGVSVVLNKPMGPGEFIAMYEEELQDYDLIYSYTNNHPSDKGNRKIGKSEKGVSRIKDHANTLGYENPNDKYSGFLIDYVEAIPRRGKDNQAEKLVRQRENALKKALKPKLVPGRGSEFVKASRDDVVKALKTAPKTQSRIAVRKSERYDNCTFVCK